MPLFQLRVEEISLRNLYLLVLNHACICLIGTYPGPQNVSFVCLFFAINLLIIQFNFIKNLFIFLCDAPLLLNLYNTFC